MKKLAAGMLVAILSQGTAMAQSVEQLVKFNEFPASFREQALAAGISADTYDREMASVSFVAKVIERNDNQPEFVRPVWAYIEGAVSDARVSNGLNAISGQKDVLASTLEKYSVDQYILGAVWGLESAYGKIQGDYDVMSALATLAYDGRRQSFGRQQLIGALKIIDNGYATREQLKGSWAGAMGQTQFIPTTYLAYAIDENGDGTRDIWQTHADVFASTANYLSRSGYVAGQPWGFEVELPEDFDYANASLSTKRQVATWLAAGVGSPTEGFWDTVDLNAEASIIVPAGANGPAFMVFQNFRAILKYNNSTSYALGIGMLSDALAGRLRPLSNDWPRGDRPLTFTERKELQQKLAEKGYNPGPVDGIVGAGTKLALRNWQRDNNMPADGYASADTLAALNSG